MSLAFTAGRYHIFLYILLGYNAGGYRFLNVPQYYEIKGTNTVESREEFMGPLCFYLYLPVIVTSRLLPLCTLLEGDFANLTEFYFISYLLFSVSR